MTTDPHGGDEGTLLDELYQRHYMTLLAAARRLTDRHTAEDAVQETFLRMLLYRPDRRRVIDLPYLLVTVRNLVRRAHRRQARALEPQHEEQRIRDAAVYDLPPALQALLSGLPAPRQDALLLTTVRGLRTDQAGSVLQLSPQVVSRKRRMAIRTLQRAVQSPAA